jgi:hypothetical protein
VPLETDTDGDGLSDESEVNVHATEPGLADTDSDGLSDGAEHIVYATDPLVPDSDNDACLDGAEAAGDTSTGGLRNPMNQWDFFDVPNASGSRDGVVNMRDIAQMIRRYGVNDEGGTAAVNRTTDPYSAPGAAFTYHPAFDRSLVLDGSRFRLGQPDGGIGLFDIMKVIEQYGHACLE